MVDFYGKSKKIKIINIFSIFVTFFLFSVLPAFAVEQEQWIPAAMHISTTVSEGNLSLDEVIKAARQKGVKVVIVTDRDFMKWEYGLWPLRHFLKKTVEMSSVFKYGIDNYLKLIELESKRNPDIVLIPGVESAPFYYWKGIPFTKNFEIRDWHKHILVLGLDKLEDYKNLPNISNDGKFKRPFGLGDIWRFFPFLMFASGIIIFRKRECSYKDAFGRELGKVSRKCRIAGTALIVLSILSIADSNPFVAQVYNQYYTNLGVKPYQALIDYVNEKGGLTFWAHPEVRNVSEQQGVKIETFEHETDLLNTKNYTGFSVFYEGYKQVGKIGGDWDHLLSEYCDGKRDKPVWAIAGLAFDHGTPDDLLKLMDDEQVYVLAPKLDRAQVLDSIKHGKVYVSRGTGKFRLLLDKFLVKDSVSSDAATVGATLALMGKPVIEISAGVIGSVPYDAEVEIKLVRNGEIVKTFKESAPFDIVYEDDAVNKKTFYRLEIKNGNQLIVVNPIFVDNPEFCNSKIRP